VSRLADEKFNRPPRRVSGKGNAPRFNEAKFVLYELNKDQTAECKSQPNDAETLFGAMEAMITDGYAFSLKTDSYSGGIGCWVRHTDPDHANGGLILSGRGSTALKALKQVLFKHHICMAGLWTEYAERRDSDFIDD